MSYVCLECGFKHEPKTIEFYNVCPKCRRKSSIPVTANNRHSIHDY